MSFFCPRLSSPSALDRFFRRNGGMDAGIIEVGIVIPPTVVILFRDLASIQFCELFLPCAESLFKFSGFGAAVENVGTKADQAIGIQNTDQLPILQRKQRVHQAVHAVYIRDSDGLLGFDCCIEHFAYSLALPASMSK